MATSEYSWSLSPAHSLHCSGPSTLTSQARFATSGGARGHRICLYQRAHLRCAHPSIAWVHRERTHSNPLHQSLAHSSNPDPDPASNGSSIRQPQPWLYCAGCQIRSIHWLPRFLPILACASWVCPRTDWLSVLAIEAFFSFWSIAFRRCEVEVDYHFTRHKRSQELQ